MLIQALLLLLGGLECIGEGGRVACNVFRGAGCDFLRFIALVD